MLDQELIMRAEQKDVRAMIEVANAYYNGDGVECDEEKSFKLFNEIIRIDPNQPQVISDLGNSWFFGFGTPVDKTKGIEFWEKACAMNNASANLWLGNAYRDGDAVPQDYRKAIEYYNKAIVLGNVRALVELGDLYYYGQGVDVDFEHAVRLYQEAAEKGHIDGQHKLAIAYRDGQGVPAADRQKAIYWFKKAADQGGANSMMLLAIEYRENGEGELATEYLLKALDNEVGDAGFLLGLVNTEEGMFADATLSFNRGYELGNAKCARELGELYQSGEHVSKDLEKAEKYLRFAAENGDAEGAYDLALLLRSKENGGSEEESFALLKQAYESGYAPATVFLADCYHNGSGTAKNVYKEIDCLKFGLAEGNERVQVICAYNLGKLYFVGNDIPKDEETSLAYFDEAAQRGHLDSMMILGQLYGSDERKDYERAHHYYDMAAKAGSAQAYIQLGIQYNDGLGVQTDYREAVACFVKARDMGLESAEDYLVFIYARHDLEELGIDVKKEIEHLRAKAEEDPEAQFIMYLLYLKDPDSTIDQCNAWNYRSARNGYYRALDSYAGQWSTDLIKDLDADMFIEGCQKVLSRGETLTPQMSYALGQSYLQSNSGNRNVSLAEKYIKDAADNGDTLAMRVLGHAYDENGEFGTNKNEALRYYEKAIAANGDLLSMGLAAFIYAERHDYNRAEQYWQRVANGGDEELAEQSREMLRRLQALRQEEAQQQYQQTRPQQYQQSQSSSSQKSGGCYIATAVYGSYDCPQVWTLRRYRDMELKKTFAGRCFISLYYKVSPTFVRLFGKTKAFNMCSRYFLDRFVSKLRAAGYDDTEYVDQ